MFMSSHQYRQGLDHRGHRVILPTLGSAAVSTALTVDQAGSRCVVLIRSQPSNIKYRQ